MTLPLRPLKLSTPVLFKLRVPPSATDELPDNPLLSVTLMELLDSWELLMVSSVNIRL